MKVIKVIVVLLCIGCLLGGVVFAAIFFGAAGKTLQPGEKEFREANKQMSTVGGVTGFGNSPAAVELATGLTKALKASRKTHFQSGKNKPQKEYLAYCELRD